MANTKTKKTKNQETVNQEVVAEAVVAEVTVEPAVEATVDQSPVVEKKAKKNKEKKEVVTIPVLDNDTLKKLFQDNGCVTRTNAANSSNVVYNTFGTQSRVLQQKKAYQLLLTNGHKSTKTGVVDTENDDAARFTAWYETLTDEQKGWVSGYSEMMNTKLSASEMPRERTVKLTSYDLLVAFIQFMSQFPENKLAKAE